MATSQGVSILGYCTSPKTEIWNEIGLILQ